jgi:hypothetical protein
VLWHDEDMKIARDESKWEYVQNKFGMNNMIK